MKSIITSFALVTGIALSAPAFAQDAGNTTSATGTTAKSMQADNTKPHKNSNDKTHGTNKDGSSTASGSSNVGTMTNPNGDKSTGGH